MVENKAVVSKCTMMLEKIIDGELSVSDFSMLCVQHVEVSLSKCKKVYFCGKLPWISNIISYVRDLHANLEVLFVDLFEGGGGRHHTVIAYTSYR